MRMKKKKEDDEIGLFSATCSLTPAYSRYVCEYFCELLGCSCMHAWFGGL